VKTTLYVMLLALCACGDGSDSMPNAATDAADVPDTQELSDSEGDSSEDVAPDAPEDAGVDGAVDSIELWRVSLRDGGEVVGQPIWTYDHNRWWEPEATWSHALFDDSRLRAYPDDRSVRVLSQGDIAAIDRLQVAGRRTYRQALREHGFVLERSPLDGVAHVYTGHDSYHLEEQGFGDNAWDLVVTDAAGRRFTGDGTRNEDFLIWGAPVVLPTAGYVVEVIRDAPDNPLGTQPGLGSPNNLVGVHLGGSYYLYLLHFQQDSIPEEIVVDAYLEQGAFLGYVGTSGVTLEPHLHLTVLWYDAAADPPRSWSVPSEFRNLWTAPSPSGPVTLHEFTDPPTGTFLSSEEF
jgi:hypothetical protein